VFLKSERQQKHPLFAKRLDCGDFIAALERTATLHFPLRLVRPKAPLKRAQSRRFANSTVSFQFENTP
jgi:hypothetical protein